MDEPRFSNCLEGGWRDNHVRANIRLGQQAGVRGTPLFLVDGRRTPSMEGMKSKVSIEARTLAEQAEAIAGHGPESALYSSIMYFSDL